MQARVIERETPLTASQIMKRLEEAMRPLPVLLTREQAAERYNISLRVLEGIYRRYSDFPVLRVGRKTMIHREAADKWFAGYIGATIDL